MDTAKVRVRRTKTGDDLVTSFSYFDGKISEGTQQFYAPVEENEFDMTPAQARAAIATDAFEVHPDSKSTLEDAEAAELEAATAALTAETPAAETAAASTTEQSSSSE